jgi:hypothetical protein
MELVFAGVIRIVLLLVGVGHVAHAFHVSEFAVGCTGITQSAAFRLDCPLQINVLVPIAHGILIDVTDDKVVDHARVSFPEDLDTIKPCCG